MTARRLEEIRDKIEEAKDKKAKAEGALENLKKSMKTEFGVDSIDELKKLLEEKKGEAERLEVRIDKLSTSLEELIDWDREDD